VNLTELKELKDYAEGVKMPPSVVRDQKEADDMNLFYKAMGIEKTWRVGEEYYVVRA